nr:pentatricopeptide repeat-containing protein At1g30610, chloroplastic-like [Populus alba]
MESDEFGDNSDGCSGQEEVVNVELDYRGGRIREFNHKVGGKVSGSEDFNETKSMMTRIAQRSPMVSEYIESIDRTIGLKENLAHAKDSLDMFGIKGKGFEEENIGSGVNKMNGGLVRNRSQADKITDKRYVLKNGLSRRSDQAFLERGHGEDFEVERAAFKSFEQSNDVIGKTKVPMWKIEEKIQKLGNWLNGADIDMPEWMFSKAMRSARVKYTDHSVLRIIQILGKLGNWRRVLQVIEWLNIRERYKSHRLRHVYTTALHVLGKAKRPVEALNLFHAMQVLNACVRRKQWEGAFWVLQQMKEKDVQPSTATYGLVMEVMLACGKYNLVHEFFKKVQKSSIPNALVYKVLVNTFWREGKTEEAVLAVKDMERRGIVGSAALYYDLARCLCTSGRCQEALDLIEKICKVANKPLVVTYTGLIQACLDSGNIQNAVYIFNQMRNFCPPNLVTCNIMLKAYLEHGLFEEANELFNKMLDDGNHISRRSDYKFRVIPDIYTFNTMLDASIAENRWDDFEYVYQKMLRHGFHFNANRHLRMVLDASRAGKGEVLEITWKHLEQEDRIPPPPLVKERFCMMLEKEDFDSALACITTNSAGESQAFCKSAWLNLFEENAQRFRKDTLMRLMHEVRVLAAQSNSPNPVLQNLLISCSDYNRPRVKVPGFNQT